MNVEKFITTILKYRWPVVIASVLTVFLLASNAKIEFDSDYHSFFNESYPESLAFDALQNIYTKDENLVIVLTDENGISSERNLNAITELVESAWTLPFSLRTDAITNFQYARATEDDLYVNDLWTESDGDSILVIDSIKSIALADPQLKDRLINEEGTITALNINIQLPYKDPQTEMDTLSKSLTKMLAEFGNENPQFEIRTAGLVPLNLAFLESTQKDMALVGGMFLMVIFVTLLMTRSISTTISTLIVVIFSIASAVGFIGLTGIKLTPPTSVFPTMILTLAVADSLHILITILKEMANGKNKKEAIIQSVKKNFKPVFITSLTTIIGFLSLNLGDMPPFWDLGNIVAFGMFMAFIFSITLLPALVSILPLKSRLKKDNEESIFSARIGRWVLQRPIAVIVGSLVIVSGMTYLAYQNEFNDDMIGYFDEEVPFRKNADYISENLTGMLNVEFSMLSGEPGGISNPSYLRNLEKFKTWLEAQPEVLHVNSFSDVVKRINKNLHADKEEFYTIPASREEAAQYLLLYEMSLPIGLDLNNQINVDKSESRLTVTVDNLKSSEFINFTDRAENHLKSDFPTEFFTYGVSPTVMFSKIGERQAAAMYKGNGISILLISLILMLALASWKLGLLSIIPNVIPVAIGFGSWFLMHGEINVGMIVVFGMTLGIVVDDTVHILSKYLYGRRNHNLDTNDAIIYGLGQTGRALFSTTIVLTAGFLVLASSSFALNSYMARLSAIIIVAALVTDFLLLPALISVFDKNK